MGTILLQAVPDETVAAIKTYAAEAGISQVHDPAGRDDLRADLT